MNSLQTFLVGAVLFAFVVVLMWLLLDGARHEGEDPTEDDHDPAP